MREMRRRVQRVWTLQAIVHRVAECFRRRRRRKRRDGSSVVPARRFVSRVGAAAFGHRPESARRRRRGGGAGALSEALAPRGPGGGPRGGGRRTGVLDPRGGDGGHHGRERGGAGVRNRGAQERRRRGVLPGVQTAGSADAQGQGLALGGGVQAEAPEALCRFRAHAPVSAVHQPGGRPAQPVVQAAQGVGPARSRPQVVRRVRPRGAEGRGGLGDEAPSGHGRRGQRPASRGAEGRRGRRARRGREVGHLPQARFREAGDLAPGEDGRRRARQRRARGDDA